MKERTWKSSGFQRV